MKKPAWVVSEPPITLMDLGKNYITQLRNAGYEKILSTDEHEEWTHPKWWWQIIEIRYEKDKMGKTWTCFEEKTQDKKTYEKRRKNNGN